MSQGGQTLYHGFLKLLILFPHFMAKAPWGQYPYFTLVTAPVGQTFATGHSGDRSHFDSVNLAFPFFMLSFPVVSRDPILPYDLIGLYCHWMFLYTLTGYIVTINHSWKECNTHSIF